MADIAADGPSSSFDDTERWLVLLGGGVDLFVDGICQRLSPAVGALRFDGQTATDSGVTAAPLRALNLLLQGLHGAIWAASDGIAWSTPAARCGLYTLVPVSAATVDPVAQPPRRRCLPARCGGSTGRRA